jgi:hypothetical protein
VPSAMRRSRRQGPRNRKCHSTSALPPPFPRRPRRLRRPRLPALRLRLGARRRGSDRQAGPRRSGRPRISPACRRRWRRVLPGSQACPGRRSLPPTPVPRRRGSSSRKALERLRGRRGAMPSAYHSFSRWDRGCEPHAQACPASLTRCEGSMPIFASARAYFDSRSVLKIRSGSAGQLSQPLAWISLSSWPGDQPA